MYFYVFVFIVLFSSFVMYVCISFWHQLCRPWFIYLVISLVRYFDSWVSLFMPFVLCLCNSSVRDFFRQLVFYSRMHLFRSFVFLSFFSQVVRSFVLSLVLSPCSYLCLPLGISFFRYLCSSFFLSLRISLCIRVFSFVRQLFLQLCIQSFLQVVRCFVRCFVLYFGISLFLQFGIACLSSFFISSCVPNVFMYLFRDFVSSFFMYVFMCVFRVCVFRSFVISLFSPLFSVFVRYLVLCFVVSFFRYFVSYFVMSLCLYVCLCFFIRCICSCVMYVFIQFVNSLFIYFYLQLLMY